MCTRHALSAEHSVLGQRCRCVGEYADHVTFPEWWNWKHGLTPQVEKRTETAVQRRDGSELSALASYLPRVISKRPLLLAQQTLGLRELSHHKLRRHSVASQANLPAALGWRCLDVGGRSG